MRWGFAYAKKHNPPLVQLKMGYERQVIQVVELTAVEVDWKGLAVNFANKKFMKSDKNLGNGRLMQQGSTIPIRQSSHGV